MICNVAYLKTRSSNLLVSFLCSLSVIPSSLSVCAVGRVRCCCVSLRVYYQARRCVLGRVQLSAISWRRSDLWNPNCVNHGLCVGDIKPPSTSPASPAGFTHTHQTHTRKDAHTRDSQGHLCCSPFHLQVRRWEISYLLCFFLFFLFSCNRDETVYVPNAILQVRDTFHIDSVHFHNYLFSHVVYHQLAFEMCYTFWWVWLLDSSFWLQWQSLGSAMFLLETKLVMQGEVCLLGSIENKEILRHNEKVTLGGEMER